MESNWFPFFFSSWSLLRFFSLIILNSSPLLQIKVWNSEMSPCCCMLFFLFKYFPHNLGLSSTGGVIKFHHPSMLLGPGPLHFEGNWNYGTLNGSESRCSNSGIPFTNNMSASNNSDLGLYFNPFLRENMKKIYGSFPSVKCQDLYLNYRIVAIAPIAWRYRRTSMLQNSSIWTLSIFWW